MKKLVYLSIILLTICSCKKDHSANVDPSDKKYAVDFNVSGFTQSTTGFSQSQQSNNVKKLDAATTTPLSSLISILYCVVYDSSGKVITTTQQSSTQTGFGSISLNLANGNYTVVFAGGQTNFTYVASLLSTDKIYYAGNYPPNPFADTFYKKISLTVNNAASSSSIAMDRIVGQVQVVIQDALPAGVKSIAVQQTTQNYNYFMVETGLPVIVDTSSIYSPGTTVTVPASSIGTTNYTVSFLTINTVVPFNVSVSVTKTNNTNYQNFITISGVTTQPNKTTVLTGKLFESDSATSGGGFTIGVNQAWNPDINIPF